MKHTKRIISMAMAIIMVCTVITVFSACSKKPNEEATEAPETTTEESTTVEEPTEEEIPEITDEDVTTTEKQDETTTQKAEQTTKKEEPTTKRQEPTTEKHKPKAKKQNETTTENAEQTTKSAAEKETVYSCKTKNHHCTTKEEHKFICSLEDKGCPYCGSHSCRSFYTLDEWGNPCYDMTRCPEYSEKEDPSIYCEHCGLKCGLGDNGTCVRFTVDTECPICGKTVLAKTCHSH